MTPPPIDDLSVPPAHLVPPPEPRGLARFSIGTAPFNAISIAALMIMSAWVVLSPGTASGDDTIVRRVTAAADERAAGATTPDDTASSPEPSAPPSATPTAAAETAPAASVTPASAGTGPAGSDSGAADRAELVALRAAVRASTRRAQAPVPTTTAPPRGPRCEDFKVQPDAQAWYDADRRASAGLDGDGDGTACEQLPGRPAPPAPPKAAPPVPTVDDLLRPTTRLYGVHTPLAPFNFGGVDEITTLAGKAPNTVTFFQTFSQEYPSTAIANAWSRQMLPVLTLEPIVEHSTSGQPLLRDITGGSWDAYLTRWALAAKAQGLPIALRFAQEMNGSWYSWSEGLHGNRPGDYVKAWRHVHDLFESAGATNVIWVWSVNRVDNLPLKSLSRVYPGDDYVDWVGMSGYLRDTNDGSPPTFATTFDRTLAELGKVAPDKLVLLTEVGAGTSEANRVAWMQSFFDALLAHPEIIGFSWFNDFKSGGDWRIQYSGATAAAFAAGVADPRYGVLTPRR